jgi:hypothetical protein
MALLWIKVLGYLKLVNKQMATFITSLTRIILSIRYFGIVLLIIVLVKRLVHICFDGNCSMHIVLRFVLPFAAFVLLQCHVWR